MRIGSTKTCNVCRGRGQLLPKWEDIREECPVCRAKGVLPLDASYYAVFNVRIPDLKKDEFLGWLVFPEDYEVDAVIKAPSIKAACECAVRNGIRITHFTVVSEPDGSLFALPEAHDLLRV
jgi:hypothetical protein